MQSSESIDDATSDQIDWKIIAPLCLTTFVIFLGGTAIAPLAVDIADTLNTSVPLVAQTMTVGLVVMGCVGLIAGPLADYVGQRRSILIGLSILVAGTIVLGATPTYPVLLLGGLIVGIGASMSIGPAFGLAAASFAGDRQRRAISRVQAAGTLGSVLGAPILTTIAALTLWRGAFAATLLGYVVAGSMIARWMSTDPPRARTSLSLEAVLAAYQPLARNIGMLSIFACTLIRAMAWFGGFFFLGAYFIKEFDLSVGQVGLIYLATGIGQFAGNLAAGSRFGHYDQRSLYVASTIALGLSWIGVYAVRLPLFVAIMLAIVAATSTGIGWINLQSILASESPAAAGTTMTLNVSISALGWAVGSAAGGAMVVAGGYQMIGLVFPVFALLAACGPLVWSAQARATARGQTAP